MKFTNPGEDRALRVAVPLSPMTNDVFPMAKIIFTYRARTQAPSDAVLDALGETGSRMARAAGASLQLLRPLQEDPFRTPTGITDSDLAAVAVLHVDRGTPLREQLAGQVGSLLFVPSD